MLEKKNFEPKIVAFCCNWCSYAGAAGAGTARKHYPANISVARTVKTCAVVNTVTAIILPATIMRVVV